MNSTIESFLSSELSRNSAKVFQAAEVRPVLVTRRDGENLVLMSERDSTSRDELMSLAAQLIAVTTDDNGTLHERLSVIFPWILALSEADREDCANEILTAARAAFATSKPNLVLLEIAAWRDSAIAIADGLGNIVDLELQNPELVARP
ncbi:MAG: hypothetical protein RL038_1129 [Actinomycetota bacterium]|jgi:hypothetical protein